MNLLPIPEPYSAGVLLSYKCSGTCKHCLYGCSPRWPADWISEVDAELVLAQLADKMRDKYPFPGQVGVNDGVHFTGGEPFLNFPLLLRLVEIAEGLGIPTTFVETNGFWARDDRSTREKLLALQHAGLDGILVSANPFILEQVPFERTERAVRFGREVFGQNAIVYQGLFFEQFKLMGLSGTLPFEEYVERGGQALQHVELFANGRVPYKMAHLFEHHPAEAFFTASCRRELVRDWHIHVDNYCNYMPGFCGGLSLGDARDLDAICGGRGRGIDLDRLPVIGALLENLAALYRLGLEWGYQEREGGYISKCHLCLEIRRHLARHGDFEELQPIEMYERLEDCGGGGDMEGNGFRAFKEQFASLEPPEALEGVWQGEPVGPGWYLKLAGPSLAIGGLGGWWGKDFDGQGGIDNILERGGALRRTLRGEVQRADSLVDGRPCLRIEYPEGSRLPWVWVVDELRQVGEGELLGMMVLNISWLPRLAFPFALHAREEIEGLG